MIFFLSTQSILDVLSGNTSILKWLRNVPMQQVEISSVSIGQALETIRRNIANPTAMRSFEKQLDLLVSTVNSSQGVIAFDEAAARLWVDLQAATLEYKTAGGKTTDLSPASRMVVATALHRGATFVEGPQPYHAAVSGLIVVSP